MSTPDHRARVPRGGTPRAGRRLAGRPAAGPSRPDHPRADRSHPARDPGRHPRVGRPRPGAAGPVRARRPRRRWRWRRTRRRTAELLGLMAGDDADPAVAAALPARPRRRCASRPWCGAATTGCGWCARPVSCSRPRRSTRRRPASGPTVAEATAGMSPGRIQEIVAAAGLPTTHDPVTAVAALTGLFTDRQRMAALLDGRPPRPSEVLSRLVWGPPYGQVTADPAAPPAVAARPGAAAADGARHGRPAPGGGPAPAGGPRAPRRRAGAARGRGRADAPSTGCGHDRGRARRTRRWRPSRSC